jgi:hypothetical protein
MLDRVFSNGGRVMMARRWILAVMLVLYAAQNAFFAIYSTSMKFGWVRATPDMQRFVPLSNATSVLQLAAGWIAIVLFVVTALRFIRRMPALGVYAVAFLLSVGTWLSFKLGTVYNQVFSADEQKFDYVLLAIMALFGFAIWLIERLETRSAAA